MSNIPSSYNFNSYYLLCKSQNRIIDFNCYVSENEAYIYSHMDKFSTEERSRWYKSFLDEAKARGYRVRKNTAASEWNKMLKKYDTILSSHTATVNATRQSKTTLNSGEKRFFGDLSIENLETGDELKLIPGETIVLGRHICGIEHKSISRKQVKISLLQDGRCFVKKFKRESWVRLHDVNIVYLDEVEVENGDILEFVGNVKIQFNLPTLSEGSMTVALDQCESADSGTESQEVEAVTSVPSVPSSSPPQDEFISDESSRIGSDSDEY